MWLLCWILYRATLCPVNVNEFRYALKATYEKSVQSKQGAVYQAYNKHLQLETNSANPYYNLFGHLKPCATDKTPTENFDQVRAEAVTSHYHIIGVAEQKRVSINGNNTLLVFFGWFYLLRVI